jgi:hypothetical protein
MFFETGRNLPSRPEWEQLRKVLPIRDEFAAVYEQAEREVIGQKDGSLLAVAPGQDNDRSATTLAITAPATDAAREWEGYGTALKPATEPICLARKPLSEKSVAANVLKWGTGAINIDGCRIEGEVPSVPQPALRPNGVDRGHALGAGVGRSGEMSQASGRWPANLIHDGSDEVVAGFPETESGLYKAGSTPKGVRKVYGQDAAAGYVTQSDTYGDSGSAARFFYCAKATTEERGEGNNHPTVKPIALMQWLVRLVTPKGGTVLDPFSGSGSTLIAADMEQFNAIGVELSPEYAAIAEQRLRDAGGMFADVQIAA